jgi:hypothetical protein
MWNMAGMIPQAGRERRMSMGVRKVGGRSFWAALAVLVVAVLIVVVVVIIKDGQRRQADGDAASANSAPATTTVGADSLPPWPAPSDATAAARNAGLPMLSSEGAVEHIHVHLDVLVDGQAVPVPANIGIDAAHGGISPLHTHDNSGVIHIESPVKRQFSLGEFFTEWGVSLSADNVGGLRATDTKGLRAFVNGEPRPGNPAAITFSQHDEIAVVFGVPQAGERVRATYDFPPGD